jgi:leucyl-tRNA synthetase
MRKTQQYDFRSIEQAWRAQWEQRPINTDSSRPKFYCLDMFPYPSGTGLHVGHWRGYVLSDVLSRYKILRGFQVLHPMGWDAFGLPAENFAIKTGVHPEAGVRGNIETFRRQLKEISAVYDWSREINTTHPGYYKWTQWIFVQMFKAGLAYEKEMPLNWCPRCKAVLANEEVVGGVCERCKTPTTKKFLRQWMLKITAYADRLLDDLQLLDWPEKVKKMQSEWIGKSYGAEVDFAVVGSDFKIKVFTTRPDTLFGATFMVLAPEHPLVNELTTEEWREAVGEYTQKSVARSSVDRLQDKEKTGVFIGAYAINPLNGEKMPVWVSDYVLADYGTGAIMCVPGHDDRDFKFAKIFDLPILQVISKDGSVCELEEAYTGDGVLVNSGDFSGLSIEDAKKRMADFLDSMGSGRSTVNYKLRDWVFSRQRYWGEPIPIIHCPHCGAVPVPEKDLPVLLPNVQSYQPTDTGESPLSQIEDWVNVSCPVCGASAKRETNTMPQWAGSSWYYLRYPDPQNDEALASPDALEKWLPVDYYVGGVEHAVLHLLYARFYTKFLYDIDVVKFKEPFSKLFNQGMITNNGRKMDKSGDNYVSPDSILQKCGCDTLRMYELFIGPPDMDAEWDEHSIEGVHRFLSRVWKLVLDEYGKNNITAGAERIRHKMIYEITSRLENWSLNTVISGFMEYTNKLTDLARTSGIDRTTLDALIVMLAPFTPHIAEELWKQTGHEYSVFNQSWPTYDEALTKDEVITIALQINGKLRDSIQIPAAAQKEDALALAKVALSARLDRVEIMREIYVPGKIINFVVK